MSSGLGDSNLAARSSSEAPSRVAAFFDMDKTLIAENSGSVYMKKRFEDGDIDTWQLARSLWDYFQYKAGILDILSWTRSMASEFAGQSEEELASEGRALFAKSIAQLIFPEARSCVRAHQERGHRVCIVSGATRYVIEPLAEELGVEHMVYTRLETQDGSFTGRVLEPICFEEGKIHLLQGFIEEESIDLARSWFYTDSVTDQPLLDLVGHPMVVNPDPRLYRLARRRRWPVRFFDLNHSGQGVTPEGLEAGGFRPYREASATLPPSHDEGL